MTITRARQHCNMAAAGLLVVAACLSLLPPTAGYPSYWAGRIAVGAERCLDHPKTQQFLHSYDDKPDMTTSITVLQASTGQPIAGGINVCAGEMYTLKIAFEGPLKRHFLLTATQGSFGGRRCDNNCYNRVCPAAATDVATLNMTVPCTAAGPVELTVTSSEGQTEPLRSTSLTLQVDACPVAAACLDTSPSPSPSVPSPSPAPTTTTSPSPAPTTTPSPSPSHSHPLNLTITKSHNRALKLSQPSVGVSITAKLTGGSSSSSRARKTLRVTAPKHVSCSPIPLMTDATGTAKLQCKPSNVTGRGSVVIAYQRLRASAAITVNP